MCIISTVLVTRTAAFFFKKSKRVYRKVLFKQFLKLLPPCTRSNLLKNDTLNVHAYQSNRFKVLYVWLPKHMYKFLRVICKQWLVVHRTYGAMRYGKFFVQSYFLKNLWSKHHESNPSNLKNYISTSCVGRSLSSFRWSMFYFKIQMQGG
jgi:hypothetical protein